MRSAPPDKWLVRIVVFVVWLRLALWVTECLTEEPPPVLGDFPLPSQLVAFT